MRRFLPLLAVLVATAAWPAASSAAVLHGVVVAKQRGTLLVASAGGGVTAVAGRAPVGARVSVAGGRVRVVGHATRAVVRGVVVGRSATTMFLSAAHHLLAVHLGRHTAAVSSAPSPPGVPLVPQPGHAISATLHISGAGGLDDEGGDDDLGAAPTGTSIQATVAAVAAGSVTLTVNGQTLTVPLPQGLTLPATLVGQQVSLQLTFPGGQTQVSGGGVQGQSIGGSDDQGGDDGNDNGGGDDG